MEGLLSASGGERLSARDLETTLGALGKRQFLLHNVNEERAEVFATRFVMSYLAGPLTREQIKTLTAGGAVPAAPASAASVPATPARATNVQPVLPVGVRQCFIPAARLPHGHERLVYQPRVLAAIAVSYVDAKLGVSEKREMVLTATPQEATGSMDWSASEELSIAAHDLEQNAEPDALYFDPPAVMSVADNYRDWEKQLRRWVGIERALKLFKSVSISDSSRSGESERDFRIRLQQLGNERRDVEAARLKQKYASKFAALEARELRAVQAQERQAEQARDAKVSAVVSVGTAVLGAIFGRGRSLGSATRVGSAVRRTGSIARETGDVRRAEETLAQVRADQEALQAEFQRELDALHGRFDAQAETLQEIVVRPKASDIEVRFIGVGWVPYIEEGTGELKPA
jgi:hypothetical protein